MVTIYVNADDPIQVDALFDAMILVQAGWLEPQHAVAMVNETRSDEERRRDNEAAQWEKHLAW